jgi:predicted RNA-binding Zn ribbon-like protein
LERAFIDLLNSDWHDWKGSGRSEDRLDKKEWVDGFLSRWNLKISNANFSELCTGLKDLRTLIGSIIRRIIDGGELHTADIEQLNDILCGTLYHQHLTGRDGSSALSVEWIPANKDIYWILAEITHSFAEVLINGDPKRFKICANPDCGWFFYDESRGLTRNWCDSKCCGNLMKVRRFRQRKKKG